MKLNNAVEGFLTDWQLRKRSMATIRLYRSCLMVFVKWLTVQDIVDKVCILGGGSINGRQ